MKEIGDNSVDLILTDHPYNLSHYSTGIAAFETERRFLGFEIDETILKRLRHVWRITSRCFPFLLKPPLGETKGVFW